MCVYIYVYVYVYVCVTDIKGTIAVIGKEQMLHQYQTIEIVNK